MTRANTEPKESMNKARIGILGGTFDPIHHAHLRIAEEALESLGLDEVLLVLASVPPHKEGCGITPFAIRWEMLRAVCEKKPKLRAVDLESKREGPSYTLDTLKAIREKYGEGVVLYLLVGMDSAVEFPTWKSYREILDLAELAVYGRPGEKTERVTPEIRDRMVLLKGEEMGISSTGIRERVSQGKSIRYLVPPEVEEIIMAKQLYVSPDARSAAVKKHIHQGEVCA